MTTLSEKARAFLDGTEFATIATVEPDGQPQLSPVWVKRDGDDIVFSTVKGRRKPANIARDPRVSVLVVPREAPYTYLEVRGTATVSDDTDDALIQELSQKYLGQPWHDEPGIERIVVRVSADKVVIRE